LEEYFHHSMEAHKLVDVEPVKLIPTWRNFKKNRDVVSKILDHFFVSKARVEGTFLLKYWVGSRGLSYHFQIIFKMEKEDLKLNTCIKFNL